MSNSKANTDLKGPPVSSVGKLHIPTAETGAFKPVFQPTNILEPLPLEKLSPKAEPTSTETQEPTPKSAPLTSKPSLSHVSTPPKLASAASFQRTESFGMHRRPATSAGVVASFPGSVPGSIPGPDPSFMSPFTPPQGVTEGALIAGRYCLEKLLGFGHIGQVYLARELQTGEVFALKVLHPWLAQQERLLELFAYEFLRMKQLEHPGVVRSFLLEQDPAYQVWFIVMEYVQGESFQEQLKSQSSLQGQGESFSIEKVLHFFAKIAPVMRYLQTKQLVHRDLKPSHFLWTSPGMRGDLKLIGFGMSAAVSKICGSSMHLGQAGASFYTAPERMLNGQPSTIAADIFSLGVILYQMLTGALPIGMAAMPSELIPGLPKEIDHVLRRALDPRWQHRYPTIDEMLGALKRAALPHIVASSQSNPAHSSSPPTASLENQSLEELHQHKAVTHVAADAPQTDETPKVAAEAEPAPTPEFTVPDTMVPLSSKKVGKHMQTVSLRGSSPLPAVGTFLTPPPLSYMGPSSAITPAPPSLLLPPIGPTIPVSTPVSNIQRLDKLRRGLSVRMQQEQKSTSYTPSVLNASNPRPPRSVTFQTQQKNISALAFSPDGCFLASASSDSTIQLWEVPSWYLLYTLEHAETSILRMSWSPQGKCLAFYGDENRVYVRDVMQTEKRHSFALHTPCQSLSWSADGQNLWAGCADGWLYVWEMASFLMPRKIRLHQRAICALVASSQQSHRFFEPDSNGLALSGGMDGYLSLWDLQTEQRLEHFHEPNTGICAVAFHPKEGTLLSGNTRGEIQYWEPQFEGQTRSWVAHQSPVRFLCMSHHGQWFLSGDQEDIIKMWRTTDGELLCTFQCQQDSLASVTLSPNSQWLATVDQGDVIKLWDLSGWNP